MAKIVKGEKSYDERGEYGFITVIGE